MYVEDRRALFTVAPPLLVGGTPLRAVVILYVYEIFVKSSNGVS